MSVCRYKRLDRARAGKAWSEAYESAAQRRTGTGVRIQTLYLVSGLVLPVWQEVKRVLAAQQRPIDRRLHVIRLETTGAPPLRLRQWRPVCIYGAGCLCRSRRLH